VRYLFDEGKVYIEINPLLAYMQPGKEPKNDKFEPPIIGSQSTKKTDFAMSVPVGWQGGKEFEPMYTWDTLEDIFRLVAYEELYFPRPSFADPILPGDEAPLLSLGV